MQASPALATPDASHVEHLHAPSLATPDAFHVQHPRALRGTQTCLGHYSMWLCVLLAQAGLCLAPLTLVSQKAVPSLINVASFGVQHSLHAFVTARKH